METTKFLNALKSKVPEYRSLPFWSWNDRLEPSELRRQLNNMNEMAMGGAFMHARAGLLTEYMSDEWFDCVDACIDEAEKLGMHVWAYDENGWPSGFADGKLLKDKENLLCYLEMRTGKFPDEDGNIVAVYSRNENGTFTKASSAPGRDDFVIIYKSYDDCYVDTLNGEVTEKFIGLVYEEYKKRLPAGKCGKGKTMPGFFTDEPHYAFGATSYSPILPEAFEKEYGYSLTDALPALFFDYEGADKHRYDYHFLTHRLFINNFIKKIYDWCTENGFELTGHTCGEDGLMPQMSANGGVMPFYLYETIPGIDYLDRFIKNGIGSRQLNSVRAQFGKPYAISEMYGCCGWDVTPLELKKITDSQYVCGVNLTCQHLYPYSETGDRKRDYPNHYSEHLPWQFALKDFNSHYNNLGTILSAGKEYAPVLMIHPMHSAYCRYRKGVQFPLVELESKYLELNALLNATRLPYHYGDEWLMSSYAHVDGNRIIVGECSYEAILIPFLYSLDSSTVALLKEFTENGGKVCLYDGKPIYVDGAPECGKLDFLHSTATFEDILSLRDAVVSSEAEHDENLRKMSRITEDGTKIIFLTNVGETDYSSVDISLPAGVWSEIDVDSFELRPLHTEDNTVRLRFKEGESHMLVSLPDGSAIEKTSDAETPEDGFIEIPGLLRLSCKAMNIFTLDYAARSSDGISFDEPMFLMGIRDNLLRERYDGEVYLKFTFDIRHGYIPACLRLAIEPVYDSVFVNGTRIEPPSDEWWFDRRIAAADIASLVHPGSNEIICKVNYHQSEHVYYVMHDKKGRGALRNSLLFDTDLDYLYLIGDFGVCTDGTFSEGSMNSDLFDGKFSLDRQPTHVSSHDVVRSSFPFFSGTLKLEFDYQYSPGMPTVLKTPGRHAVLDVSVNGAEVGRKLFDDETDLSSNLKPGNNTIGIAVSNSMRNTFGPHHRKDEEFYGIAPMTFNFENEWNGRECKDFRDRYSFIRFGIK